MLFCYACHQVTHSFTCEHCGSDDDVEPFDTDGPVERPDYSLDSGEMDDGNGEWE